MDHQTFTYNDNDNVEFYNSPGDYYDLYDYEFYEQSNINEEIDEKYSLWSNLSFQQLCSQCVIPAGLSTFNLIGTTLVLCIFFRLIIIISIKIKIFPDAVLHIVCAICGILPILLFNEDGDIYQLLLEIITFPIFCYILSIICLLTLRKHCSIVFSTIILMALFYHEFFSNNLNWQKIKSIHMLMSMKAMAILFDIKSNELHTHPSVVHYAGYMMSAGTVNLGPFLTFQEYSNAFILPVYWNKTKVCRVIWKIAISLFCFILSICVVDWILIHHLNNYSTTITMLITMYKLALEFRTSHYFIAYISTVFAMVCGYQSENNSEITVTNPMFIEWPKSLLNVVVYWNKPMHFWLKKYIFNEVLKYGNKNKCHSIRIIAIGSTYFVSSLLHGFEQRLSAVLLSLAAYTYVEYQLRSKLAIRFPKLFYFKSEYRRSKKYTSSFNKNTLFIWGTNIIFTILNIIHLAYLGSIMDMSLNKFNNTSYSISFASWHHAFYFSHIIVIIMYILSIIL